MLEPHLLHKPPLFMVLFSGNSILLFIFSLDTNMLFYSLNVKNHQINSNLFAVSPPPKTALVVAETVGMWENGEAPLSKL